MKNQIRIAILRVLVNLRVRRNQSQKVERVFKMKISLHITVLKIADQVVKSIKSIKQYQVVTQGNLAVKLQRK